MNPEFEDCLRKNKVRKFTQGKSLVGKELILLGKILMRQESLWRGENLNGPQFNRIIQCSTQQEHFYTIRIIVKKVIIV